MHGFGFCCDASVVAEVHADVFFKLGSQSVTEVVASGSTIVRKKMHPLHPLPSFKQTAEFGCSGICETEMLFLMVYLL